MVGPYLAVAAALLFTAMYVATALPRVVYPYDLDFIEDSMLMESLRFAQGQPVFLPPNAEFTPHVYMPLYSWLGGLLFRLAGPGFAPLRLLSLAAAVFTAGLTGWIAWQESGQRWLAVACAGLFLGGYRISGFWYELVRVDTFFIALALAGLAVGVSARSARGYLLAAVILALSFWTKQTGLLFAAGLGLYLLLTAGRPAWLFGLVFGGLAALPLAYLHLSTGGWFTYYTFGIASSNPIEAGRLAHYVVGELFGLMAGLSVMAVGAALLGLRRAGPGLFREQPWLAWLALAAAISGLGRAPVGGNLNNLIPVYTLLCLAPALLYREWQARPELLPGWRDLLVAGLVVAQFGLGVYNPGRYIPGPAMRQAGDRLVARLAAVDGEVLVMMHPYYAWLAGKTASAQLATLWYSRERGARPLPADFVARIAGQHYATIVSSSSLFETEPDIARLLETYYYPAEALSPAEAPPTITGMVVRPEVIYLPR